jgi:hypothetical protein
MKQQRYGWLLLLAAMVLHAGFVTPLAARQTEPITEGEALTDDYVAGDFGRLLYQENGVTMRRSSADADSSLERVAGLNAPVFPGDGVITAFDQRAEIQLAGGSLVRVDRASDLTFLSLPDPYAEIADNTVLQLEQGIVRIDALLSSDSEFRIDTLGATAFLLDDSDVYIQVDEGGVTHIASFRGVIEIVASGERVLLRSGNRTSVYPGSAPEAPKAFNTLRLDDFGRWVRERDSERRSTMRYAENSEAYKELPDEVRPYYRELSSHGRWVYADDYGWVWYPDSVGSDWRPYYDGYWSYGSRGYFWVSHEPWGWAPYHYGRWGNVGGSWCWIPGRVFGGAWVAWSWGSAYVGWSPLGYWNSAYCGTPYYYGYYGPSWSFVNYNHFHYRNYRRHAVGYDHIDHRVLRDHAVVTRPPRARPRDLARSADERARAFRSARDGDRRMRSLDGEQRRAGTSLRETDRRLVADRRDRIDNVRRRTGGSDRDARRAGPDRDGRDRSPGIRGGGARAGDTRDGAERRVGGARSPRGGTDIAPRTGTQGGAVRSGASRNQDRDRDAANRRRGTTRPSEGSQNTSDTRRRMRDVYDRAAEPRSSGSRRTESDGGSDSERSTRPRSTPRSSSSETRDRDTRGSEGSRPRATPRSSGGSRERATPSRSSGSSRPKATPRSNGGSKPRATPSRSSGGSKPRATPSRSSGGSKPRATPSRGSGGSKSRPSRGKKD